MAVITEDPTFEHAYRSLSDVDRFSDVGDVSDTLNIADQDPFESYDYDDQEADDSLVKEFPQIINRAQIGFIPPNRKGAIRSCVINSFDSSRAYFFKGGRVIDAHWTPGVLRIVRGPEPIGKRWPKLAEENILFINGLLRVSAKNHRYYLFTGQKYCLVEFLGCMSSSRSFV
jgi:hypothetical protein